MSFRIRDKLVARRSFLLLFLGAIVVGVFSCACASTTTRPIASGQSGAGSIASLEPVTLGGVRQWILIRGVDVTKPLLLKIHGGPGQAEMAAVGYNAGLEQDFVVVEWDQRGAGKSAASADPVSGMTLARIADDAVELSQRLLERFGRSRLLLVGHSWGSVVGLLAVQKAPELYSAFVSTGQIVDTKKGWGETYRFLMEEAVRRHDAEAQRQLTEIGPPPFSGSDSSRKREVFGRWIEDLGASWHAAARFDRVGMMLGAPEYSWPEKFAYPAAADRSFSLLGPDLEAVELGTQVPEVKVPIYFAAGRLDHLAPTDLARNYFDRVEAPGKDWRWFENSAHFPMFEEPEAFRRYLVEIAARS